MVSQLNQLISANPFLYKRKEGHKLDSVAPADVDENDVKHISQQEIFDHIRDIQDPELPKTLGELNVVSEDAVEVDDKYCVRVTFTPTNKYCGMALEIGLYLRVKLMLSLPSCYKVEIKVAPGTHTTEAAVNKQLNDKERLSALMENPLAVKKIFHYLYPTEENDIQEYSSSEE